MTVNARTLVKYVMIIDDDDYYLANPMDKE